MRRAIFLCALAASGCVQLVAFDQPIVGQRDVVPGEEGELAAQLCDADVEMGTSVLCAESCEIDPASGQTSCGERVALAGNEARIDLTSLEEVEVTLTACAAESPLVRIRGANGARVELAGQALTVTAAEEAGAQPFRHDAYLPAEGCIERTLVFQTGRLGLEDLGGRLCSDHLVPVAEAWSMELSDTGLRGVELCLRGPRQPSAAEPSAAEPSAAEPSAAEPSAS